MKRLAYLFLLPVILLNVGFFWDSPTWKGINETIERSYPAVQNIDIESLKTAIDADHSPTLIDVRKEAEFAISHLPGAVNITEVSAVNYPKDRHLVIYCSVGIRSAKFADKLNALGYSKVTNLHGSIFAWANKGYKLMRGKKTVRTVHPYNRKWGKLLDRKLHQYTVGSP